MTTKAERVRLASILRSKFPDGVPFDLIAQTETINKKKNGCFNCSKKTFDRQFFA